MPSRKDPRSYVKQVPLPITTQKGLKLQARGDSIYNPTTPSREEVRKSNYTRRILQMTQQGFRSLPHKPYHGIGDPFYLDEKKLILHALGQWDERHLSDSSSCSDNSDDESGSGINQQAKKPVTPANFVLRRTRKDLNTLPKEIASGKDMIRSVRLGHGLFQLLRKERQMKSDAKQRELREKQEARRNEWQPPKYDSSSDGETDDELMEEVDLRTFMVPCTPAREHGEGGVEPPETSARTDTLFPPGTRNVAFTDMDSERQFSASVAPSARSCRSSTQPSRNRKRMPAPRPYTPQHCNISADYNAQPDKESLFRQLCALYWLLEAMNIEPPKVMGPITLSWNLKEIGGTKISADRVTAERGYEHKWKQFVAQQAPKPPGAKRFSTTGTARMSISKNPRRSSAFPRGSVSSLQHSPSGSQSHLSMSQGYGRDATTIHEGSVLSTLESSGLSARDEDDSESHPEVFSEHAPRSHTPGNMMHSQILEEQSTVLDESISGPHSDYPSTPSSAIKKRRDKRFPETALYDGNQRRQTNLPANKVNATEYEYLKQQILESINKSEEDPRMHKLANPTEKRSGSEYRAEYNVRPESTAEVVKYQSQLPSATKGSMCTDLRQRFSEVSEESALQLHDVLEAVERERMRKIQDKFSNLPMKGSLHRAVSEMRSKSVIDDDSKEKQRRSSIHQPWFEDLINAIPDDMKEDWNFSKILEKLAKYGLVDANKQSALKFLKVLSGLRDWEVCCPDIVAAVEFCREKIIEMSVEEYEEFFQQQFPMVTRPKTAPPTMKSDRRNDPPPARPTRSAYSSRGQR